MGVRDLFELGGKVALVTGGSRGLGLQIAKGLSEMGARIAISARKPAELAEAKSEFATQGIDVLTVAHDLAVTDQMPALVEVVMGHYGRIDILVNNAGASWGAPAEKLPLEAWNKVMNLNATSVFAIKPGRRQPLFHSAALRQHHHHLLVRRAAHRHGHEGGSLLRVQGRCPAIDPGPGHGVGSLRHPRQRDLPGLLPVENWRVACSKSSARR